MPADYLSTARALALPVSPLESPSSTRRAISPPWRRRSRSDTFRPKPQSLTASLRDDALATALKIQRYTLKLLRRLSWWQKILVAVIALVTFVLGILFIVYNEKLLIALEPVADKWRALRGGWIISWFFTFFCAFPPVIGYSSSITVAGFVYGFPNGWFIAATATVAGSLASFIVSRTVLSGYVKRLVADDQRFNALSMTLKHDGLKILCMIRLCPLPYSISNGAMATFPTVKPIMFALATAIATPKLAIHIFVGSRMAEIARRGGKMDFGTKAINYAGMIFGLVVGVAVGWVVYQKTMARAQQLEEEEITRTQGVIPSGNDGWPFPETGRSNMIDPATIEDDISLYEQESMREVYRDEFYEDEDLQTPNQKTKNDVDGSKV